MRKRRPSGRSHNGEFDISISAAFYAVNINIALYLACLSGARARFRKSHILSENHVRLEDSLSWQIEFVQDDKSFGIGGLRNFATLALAIADAVRPILLHQINTIRT